MVLDQPFIRTAAVEQISGDLADRLSQHLQDEESALVFVLDAVRNLHRSLLDLNGNELSASLDNEALALQRAQAVQRRRHQFRDEMSHALGLPADELTLTVLASHTSGPLRDLIVETRRRLSQMAAETNRLNRQNAAMIKQALVLVRGIVGKLTRTAGIGESYNAGGVREEAHVGSLLEWGG